MTKNWVKAVGNDAAHDVTTQVDADDAKDILELTEAMLVYVFTLDLKFRAFEQRRARRAATAAL